LPVLHYRLTADRADELMEALGKQVSALREQGYTFMTFSGLRDLMIAQQKRDIRLDPKQVIVAVSGMNPSNMKAVSSALNIANINATLFIETQHVGLSGITEKALLTMMANGFDIQSGTHTGDDLRALTNAQVELELQQSRKILENYTHKTVFAVSYPQGGTNDRIAQIAADAGYLFGIGDDADRSFSRSQLLRVPAMTVFPSMSIEEVVKFVTGS
jgi:peptidoglycan/xylan/chitin deacetylase (PgdA/CDA1 family)